VLWALRHNSHMEFCTTCQTSKAICDTQHPRPKD
jgi:hypothetical protein